jgi:tetratricopeptide (TPR) repeat protein
MLLLLSNELYSQSAEEYYDRALAKGKSEDYAGAISDFTKALKIDPEYSLAYLERGSYKGRLGEHTEAIADITKAIELDPKYARAYFDRGFNKMGLAIGVNNINKSLKDSGCLDFSKAAELGYSQAYDSD